MNLNQVHIIMMHLEKRAETILLAASEETNDSIQNTTGLTKNRIMIWHSHYATANIDIATVEAKTPNKLRAAITAVLSDKQRPAELSLPFSHRTPFLLCHEVIKRDIVTSISSTQISCFLIRKGMKATSGERLAES